MEEFRVAWPATLTQVRIDTLLEAELGRMRGETYIHSQEVNVQQSLLPLVMLLPEADYASWWNAQPAERRDEISVILLEDPQTPQLLAKPETGTAFQYVEVQLSPKRWEFTLRQAIQTLKNQIHLHHLEHAVLAQAEELNRLNEIGVALSAEKDLKVLLDLIVTKAMELAHADAGSLYLIESLPEIEEDPQDYFKGKRFRFEVAKNDSRHVPFQSFVLPVNKKSIYGYVAITGKSLRINDAYFIPPDMEYGWGGREFDKSINYRTRSMLTVPMFDREDKIIGVIQLINCKKTPGKLGAPEQILDQVIPFSEEHVRAIESIASQAAVALLNARLLESIQNLFDGFINASVKAIESRDPTTSGHSSRVAVLTVALGEAVNRTKAGRFGEIYFSDDQLQEIRYASLLHDFGKIGVREQVLVKAKKLYPYEAQKVMDRFIQVRQRLELQFTKQQLQYFLDKSREEALELLAHSQKELKAQLDEIDDYLKFIVRCNEPTVLAQAGFDRLQEIGKRLFYNEAQIPVPLLNHQEVASLSVAKGSLNQQDRLEIESHVSHTYRFLSIIPWTKSLQNVPEIAYAHHEKLNGLGYPRKLTEEQIPLQSKMMTIADIYDALTAWDRPYKKALPVERALNILELEAKDRHIDKDLLDLFIRARLFQLVARPESPKRV